MNLIVRHTEYLLGAHDCVIVPGFGAFIANYLPAHIEEEQIWPPRREVSFNAELSLGDGLLARSIARGEGISYDNACRLIASEVDCMAHQLEADGHLTFGRIGRFLRSEESAPTFKPAQQSSMADPFYALIPVDMLSSSEEESIASEKRRADRTHFYLPISRNIIKIAASVAMLVGVLMMLITPLQINDTPTMASVARTSSSALPQERPIEIVPTKTANPQLFIAIPAADKAGVMADTTLRSERRAQADRFILVVASLASDAQAQRYIAEVNDPSLKVIEHQGKFRVYAVSGDTYENVAAMRSRSDIASRYPEAWVCRK